jgi:hypothetical protein
MELAVLVYTTWTVLVEVDAEYDSQALRRCFT